MDRENALLVLVHSTAGWRSAAEPQPNENHSPRPREEGGPRPAFSPAGQGRVRGRFEPKYSCQKNKNLRYCIAVRMEPQEKVKRRSTKAKSPCSRWFVLVPLRPPAPLAPAMRRPAGLFDLTNLPSML